MTFAELSPREQQVARLVAEGLTSKEIGLRLGTSYRTVETQRYLLMQKLELRNVVELVRLLAQPPGNPGDWRSLERAGY